MIGDIIQHSLCPYCNDDATQKHLHTHRMERRQIDAGTLVAYECDYQYVYACETCNRILIFGDDEPWFYDAREEPPNLDDFLRAAPDIFKGHTQLLFPKPPQLNSAIPKSIRDEYAEATKVKSSPNAFASQIRRCLEAVCTDRGIASGTLEQRLDRLATECKLPTIISDIAHQLRDFGNTGVHPEKGHVVCGEIEAIDRFFHSVIDHIYVRPQELNELSALLNKYSHRVNLDETGSVN